MIPTSVFVWFCAQVLTQISSTQVFRGIFSLELFYASISSQFIRMTHNYFSYYRNQEGRKSQMNRNCMKTAAGLPFTTLWGMTNDKVRSTEEVCNTTCGLSPLKSLYQGLNADCGILTLLPFKAPQRSRNNYRLSCYSPSLLGHEK